MIIIGRNSRRTDSLGKAGSIAVSPIQSVGPGKESSLNGRLFEVLVAFSALLDVTLQRSTTALNFEV
jgi:hypothetical protein